MSFLVYILVMEAVYHFVDSQGILSQSIIGLIALLLSVFVGFTYNKFVNYVIYKKCWIYKLINM